MKDDFESIRAERDAPARYQPTISNYTGLWKQIALGIIVGYITLGIISAIGWLICIKLLMSGMQIGIQ